MTNPNRTTVHRPKPTLERSDSDDNVAHIVMKGDQMRGYVAGDPIEALCGKIWVPSRDYQGLPVCQACVEERDRLVAGMNNLN